MVVVNDDLMSYIKDVTQPETWYNCQSRDGNASYLFNILSIPGLSENDMSW